MDRGTRRVSRIYANCFTTAQEQLVSPEEIEVMKLESYSRPTYNKLVHSAMTRRSTVVDVIHKLTVDEFFDHTNTPTTCCGEIF